MQADPDRDFVRLGDDFFIAFLFGDLEDVSELHRGARAIWLELKSDDVAETRKKILDSGLVKQLDIPHLQLYFQVPGGHACGWWGWTKTYPFMRERVPGLMWRKLKQRFINRA